MQVVQAWTLALALVTSLCVSVQAEDIAKLVTQLRDTDPYKSAQAAQALAALGKAAEPAIPNLIDALADDRSGEHIPFGILAPRRTVASFASEALFAIGPAATENLILELRDARETVRELAMQTLGGIGKPASASLPELKQAARQEEQPGLRIAALEAYIKIAANKRDTVALLTRALLDASPDVRGLAARELGELGPAASPAVPLLVRRLIDQEYRAHWISNHASTLRAVRFDACEALGKIGVSSQNVVDALTYRMARDDDPEVRVSAALALLRLDSNNQAAMNALIAAIATRECSRFGPGLPGREEAAIALDQLGPKAAPAFDALTQALDYGDEGLRYWVLKAIQEIEAATPRPPR